VRILVLNYEFPPLGGGAGNATFTVRRIRSPRARQGQCSVGEMGAFMALSCLPALWRGFVFRPEIVVAFFSIPSAPAAWLVQAAQGVPYIISLRGGDVPGFDEKNIGAMHRMTAPITDFLWRHAAAVVANSAGLRTTARRFAPELPILEIPNGVDTTRFSPGAASLRNDVPQLLFVGRLARQKGVDVLLDALALVRDHPWQLVVAGDGPERAPLAEQVSRLGLADRVHFRGWVQREDLPDLYRSADVFVFPSHDEGMPNVVLEAMASALPIIATRVPGNDELVRDNGKLVPPGDARAFAEALQPLLSSETLREQLANSSRALAVAHYSWASPAIAYERLFTEITHARAGFVNTHPDS
jgi:glycosyltransferase involved in cell wall biosynthesis